MEYPPIIQKLLYFRASPARLNDALVRAVAGKFNWHSVPHVYMTLRCNLKCPYCANGLFYNQTDHGYPGRSIEEWIGILGKLKSRLIVLTGGEPLLIPDLPQVINSVEKKFLIYTNLPPNLGPFLSRLTRPVSISASIHVHPTMDQERLKETILKRIRELEASKSCLYYSLHLVQYSGNESLIGDWRRFLRSQGIPVTVNLDQYERSPGASMSFRKTVTCRYPAFYIGPDGRRYHCISRMIRRVENSTLDFETRVPERLCDDYGSCAACDEVAQITELR